MSETNETSGRCRREIDSIDGCAVRHIPGGVRPRHVLADAIDRLAADVAAIKAAVCGNSPKTSDSSPAAPQAAAPPAGWLTEGERALLRGTRNLLGAAGFLDEPKTIDDILSRAGSPPVVEVPVMPDLSLAARSEAQCYRAAMTAAGVPWKEV